jgi:hypothetical protein
MARDALLMVLDVYKDEGLPIPAPITPLQVQAEGRQFITVICAPSAPNDKGRRVRSAILTNRCR